MSQQRPPTLTPCTIADLAEALQAAATAIGMQPTRPMLLVLLAQWHLETGGGHACIAWNLGNAKSVPNDGYDWCEFQTTEYVKGEPEKVIARFRAFATLHDGATDYLHLLSHRFAHAWPAVLAGDAVAFATQLHEAGYYTAPVADYIRGMQLRMNLVAKNWPEPEPVVPSTDRPIFITPDLETEPDLEDPKE